MTSDINHIINKLFEKKWELLGTFALVIVSATLLILTSQPEYESDSLILIDTGAQPAGLGVTAGFLDQNRNVFNEIEIMKSRTIARRVADVALKVLGAESDVLLYPNFYDTESERKLSVEEVARRFEGRLVKIEPVSSNVDIIRVTARSTSPVEAALIADIYADEFVAYNTSRSKRRATAGVEFLKAQSERFDTLLVQAESSVISFIEENGVVDPEQEAEALLERIMELEAERYRTQFDIRALNSEIEVARRELDNIIPGYSGYLVRGGNDGMDVLRREIVELELHNSGILALNPELAINPDLNDTYADNQILIERYSDQLTQLIQKSIDEVSNHGFLFGSGSYEDITERIYTFEDNITNMRIRLSGLQSRLDIVDSELLDYNRQITAMPNKSILLSRLTRDLDTSAHLYTSIFNNLGLHLSVWVA